MFFNMFAVFAEFKADLLRMRTREGMAIARSWLRVNSTAVPANGLPGARGRLRSGWRHCSMTASISGGNSRGEWTDGTSWHGMRGKCPT